MQNKPNLLDAQMNVNKVLTEDYENVRLHRRRKNKPNQTQPVVSLSNLFQTKCTLCEFFLFFIFLCPSYNLAMQTWTIKELLDWITDYLTKNNVDAPRLSAELLLSFVLGLERIELYTGFDKKVGQEQLDKLHTLVKRCAGHEPVPYLIGQTEFYSLPIKVTPDCLIPRPETELLVEKAIEFLRLRSGGPQLVCDLCTGSGCIAVAIAKNFPTAKFIATDICDAALSVAAKNVSTHKLNDRIELLCGDLFEPIIEGLDATGFDLIVCNPPYVTTAEYEGLDKKVKDYEPQHALHAGADGLDVCRRIIDRANEFLKPDAALMLEIGFAQGRAVEELLEKTGCFTEIKIEKDYTQNDRIAIAKKKSL